MKLNWIKGETESRRPYQDLRDIWQGKSDEQFNGPMARDVETVVNVSRILESRNRYKRPNATSA